MITVLVVDDHKSLTEGLELLFENDSQIKIIGVANSGLELLEILQKQVPDILLTDVSMPGVNGVELCRRVRDNFPSVKVIAYSMFDTETAIREMKEAGIVGYILKKSSLNIVRDAIVEVSKGYEYYDDLISKELLKPKKDLGTVRLSKSEKAILKLIAQNKTSSEIADIRFTAVSTVQKHRKNIIQKLGLSGSGKLLEYAIREYKHL
ncbi:MAG: response regulator transcription factor [Nonlabens sp.]